MITLYEHPLSPYAQKVKIFLLEKGIPFELKTPAIGTGGAEAAWTEASPRAEVPALIDGPTKIFDSTIICEYIEDKYPQKPMRPASAEDRKLLTRVAAGDRRTRQILPWGLGIVGPSNESSFLDRTSEAYLTARGKRQKRKKLCGQFSRIGDLYICG